MCLNRIALLVTSIAAAACGAGAAAGGGGGSAEADWGVRAEGSPTGARAEPPTVEVPPPVADAASAPPIAPPTASTEAAASDPPAGSGQLSHLDDREKPPPAPDAVKGTAIISNVSVSGAVVSNAARVVAGMRAGFRQCYNRSLQQNPKSQGQIRLTLEVQPDGAVQSVTSAPTGTLSEGSVACVTRRARVGQFAVTDGASATVSTTVTFTPP